MLVFPRYIHHSQTGRLTRHSDTSYALLTFLTLAVGVLLATYTMTARAGTTCGTPDLPQCTGSYTVNAVVPGPRPATPATILVPSSGQTFSTNPVTVSGTCPAKALIKIFTNGILVGSIFCSADGKFSIPIDLVVGSNALTALPYNTLDQVGPSSPTVNVTLNQPPGGYGFSTELIIQSQNFYRGTQPGQEVSWPIELVGGQAPYAVVVTWGDGSSDLVTRLAPGPFTMKHTYQQVGGYLGSFPLIIRATDAVGHTAYLQLTTIVNAAGANNGSGAATPSQWLKMFPYVWPLWVLLLFMVTSFWLGERREKHIMRRQMEALA